MAGTYDCIDTVRALSQEDISKLTNAQLKKALVPIVTAEEPSNNDLLNELREIKEKIRDINIVKEEVKGLTEKIDSTYQIIHQQQLFLEYLDNKERRCNLIISGLAETADNIGSDDAEKLKNVLSKAKCPESIDPSTFVLRRLGQLNPNFPRGRFLHVTVTSPQQRDTIIATSKQLRNAGPAYSSV